MVEERKEQRIASVEERRQHRRLSLSEPVKMEATLHGRFIDIMELEMTGATIDVGNGGLLASVDQTVLPGVRCRVEFDGKESGDPESLAARVLRTSIGTGEKFLVALEFDDPEAAARILGAHDIGRKEKARLELDSGDAQA